MSHANDNSQDAHFPGNFTRFLVASLILLERKQGAITTYEILDPFLDPFYVSDTALEGAKRAADKIWRFAKLPNKNVYVQTETLDGAAGSVELEALQQGDVTITIHEEVLPYPAQLLATLAHEITHVYRDVHGLWRSLPAADIEEKLTDITAVFLGFGKLLLEGTYKARHHGKRFGKYKSGYLSMHELAIAYIIVCAMRSIPKSSMYAGLSEDSSKELLRAEKSISHYLDDVFHSFAYIGQLSKHLRQSATSLEKALDEVENSWSELEARVLRPLEHRRCAANTILRDLRKICNELRNYEQHDPALRYLEAIRFKNRGDIFSREVNNEMLAVQTLNEDLAAIQSLLKTRKRFSAGDMSVFERLKKWLT